MVRPNLNITEDAALAEENEGSNSGENAIKDS